MNSYLTFHEHTLDMRCSYSSGVSLVITPSVIGWLLVLCPLPNSNVSRAGYNSAIVPRAWYNSTWPMCGKSMWLLRKWEKLPACFFCTCIAMLGSTTKLVYVTKDYISKFKQNGNQSLKNIFPIYQKKKRRIFWCRRIQKSTRLSCNHSHVLWCKILHSKVKSEFSCRSFFRSKCYY